MSFILDALRKSEHERQRQADPGIADLRTASAARPTFPVWAIAVAALLAVNIVVVLVLVVRGDFHRSADPAPPVAETPVADSTSESRNSPTAPANLTQQTNPAAASASEPGADVGATATAATEDPAPVRAPPHSAEAALPAPPDYSQPVVEATDSAPRPAIREPRLFAPNPAARSAAAHNPALTETLPTLSDVILKGGNVPTEWHLDIHVYAPLPADRFVFLNKSKYREGAQTAEGATVEHITQDGVVLNYHGTRFLLPRE